MKEKTNKKVRIDALLVEKGLIESRSRARAVIMSGGVYVRGQMIDKPGTLVNVNDEINIKEIVPKFVSRGGLKLEKAINEFGLNIADKLCLDVGASTGGFTDCLLQSGAQKVFSVDVGYGQLHWKLRNDPRVIMMERVNARYLKKQNIEVSFDVVTIDVSFISLKKILKPILQFMKSGSSLIALIKPQFEVGKGEVGKGGIVRDPAKHKAVIEDIENHLEELGLLNIRTIESPILGTDGNREFLVHARLGDTPV